MPSTRARSARPSRALIEESIYDEFMGRALERIAAIRQGHPLDPSTQLGAVSTAQLEKIASYVEIGKQEGAELLIGGDEAHLGGELEGGFYFEPTVFKGHNKMRIFQEEIFRPVLAVTTFRNEAEALEIANDTMYGLGAGVWTRDTSKAFRMGRAIKAGRVWTNCYHLYPAHAAFGGYKVSGVGRENHRMMLDHYSQTSACSSPTTPSRWGSSRRWARTRHPRSSPPRPRSRSSRACVPSTVRSCSSSRGLLRRQLPDVLPEGELLLGPNDLLLGDVGGCPSTSTRSERAAAAATIPARRRARRRHGVLARGPARPHFAVCTLRPASSSAMDACA